MNMQGVKQYLRIGGAGMLLPLLFAGLCAAADTDAQSAQSDTQAGVQASGTLDCTNQEVLTWCFADDAEDDALSHCEDYTANTPELDGCLGGNRASSACGSSYWKIAAYYCP
jgi:hypothetical protein